MYELLMSFARAFFSACIYFKKELVDDEPSDKEAGLGCCIKACSPN